MKETKVPVDPRKNPLPEANGMYLPDKVPAIGGGALMKETNLKLTESKSIKGSHPRGESTDHNGHIGGHNTIGVPAIGYIVG